MVNFDYVTKGNIKKHNLNWPNISDHPYRILIIGNSGFGETNSLLNLISQQPDIDRIYLYIKNPSESKYQLLVKKKRKCRLKVFKLFKIFH